LEELPDPLKTSEGGSAHENCPDCAKAAERGLPFCESGHAVPVSDESFDIPESDEANETEESPEHEIPIPAAPPEGTKPYQPRDRPPFTVQSGSRTFQYSSIVELLRDLIVQTDAKWERAFQRERASLIQWLDSGQRSEEVAAVNTIPNNLSALGYRIALVWALDRQDRHQARSDGILLARNHRLKRENIMSFIAGGSGNGFTEEEIRQLIEDSSLQEVQQNLTSNPWLKEYAAQRESFFAYADRHNLRSTLLGYVAEALCYSPREEMIPKAAALLSERAFPEVPVVREMMPRREKLEPKEAWLVLCLPQVCLGPTGDALRTKLSEGVRAVYQLQVTERQYWLSLLSVGRHWAFPVACVALAVLLFLLAAPEIKGHPKTFYLPASILVWIILIPSTWLATIFAAKAVAGKLVLSPANQQSSRRRFARCRDLKISSLQTRTQLARDRLAALLGITPEELDNKRGVERAAREIDAAVQRVWRGDDCANRPRIPNIPSIGKGVTFIIGLQLMTVALACVPTGTLEPLSTTLWNRSHPVLVMIDDHFIPIKVVEDYRKRASHVETMMDQYGEDLERYAPEQQAELQVLISRQSTNQSTWERLRHLNAAATILETAGLEIQETSRLRNLAVERLQELEKFGGDQYLGKNYLELQTSFQQVEKMTDVRPAARAYRSLIDQLEPALVEARESSRLHNELKNSLLGIEAALESLRPLVRSGPDFSKMEAIRKWADSAKEMPLSLLELQSLQKQAKANLATVENMLADTRESLRLQRELATGIKILQDGPESAQNWSPEEWKLLIASRNRAENTPLSEANGLYRNATATLRDLLTQREKVQRSIREGEFWQLQLEEMLAVIEPDIPELRKRTPTQWTKFEGLKIRAASTKPWESAAAYRQAIAALETAISDLDYIRRTESQ